MLTELLAEIRNYFEVPNGRHFGKFEISGGSIAPLDFLQDGQYFRIIGSVFNDGVYQYPATSLTDEVFDGAVWSMAVPPSVIDLAAEIEEYNKSDAGKASPYTSESFGGSVCAAVSLAKRAKTKIANKNKALITSPFYNFKSRIP